MIRSIIWDVDGTLFDTYPAIVQAFLRVLDELLVGTSREGQAREQVPEVDALAKIGLSHCAHELEARHGLPAGAVSRRFGELYEGMPVEGQGPFPGTRELCEAVAFRGGINVIATHRARASTERLLAAHGMQGLFRDIASIEDGYPKKPDPALFRAVMERRSLEPALTLAVGDRDIDILAAQAAGIRGCLYRTTPLRSRPELCIGDYGELLRRIESL